MILVPRHNRGGIFLGRGGGQLTSRGAIRQALSLLFNLCVRGVP
jgi:hypothetical protein